MQHLPQRVPVHREKLGRRRLRALDRVLVSMFPLPSPRLGGHPLVKRLGTTALQQLGQASLHPFQLSDPGVVRESELF